MSANDLQATQNALPLRTPEDIVRMRQLVREQAMGLGFSLVDQTKIVTAASELARNAMVYGGGGEVAVQPVAEGLVARPSVRAPELVDVLGHAGRIRCPSARAFSDALGAGS